MPSPVNGDSFVIATSGANLCSRFTNLLNLAKVMKSFFDWAIKSDGSAENAFKALFLPPTNTVWAFYSTDTDTAAVATAVEAWYRDTGDTGDPFFRLCDGTNGTPNLIGKTLIGAGAISGGSTFNAGVAGGDENVTLTPSQIPNHIHHGKAYVRGAAESGVPGVLSDPTGITTEHFHSDSGHDNSDESRFHTVGIETTTIPAGSGEAHSNMPPYMVIYYAIRTSRAN